MKMIFILLALLPLFCLAQDPEQAYYSQHGAGESSEPKGKNLSEYKASNSVIYHINDTVHLGRGSAPNGDFLYLTLGGWAAVMTYNSNKDNDQFNVSRAYAHTNVIVKKIKQVKLKGAVKTYFTVGGGNISNYHLDIDAAAETCEITPCKSDTSIQPQISIADEIAKLKDLLDKGAITQEEYDAAKKKLLDKL